MDAVEGVVRGSVTVRPGKMRVLRIWGGSLVPAAGARSRGAVVPHSAGLRQTLLGLVVMELVVAFAVSSMLPPAVRVAHAVLEAVLVLAGLGAAAALIRSPHEVREEQVVLRTGFFGEVSVPRSAVRSAGPALRTVPGRGPRSVPGDPTAVACSAEPAVDVVLHLRPPVRLDLGPAGGVVTASTLYTSAVAAAAFRAALGPADGPADGPAGC
ncbi:hypothetical protein ACFV7Q_31965 [Streptomyces sp. NPDC059851]|uniref:hypothetical protein n=1 Tax=Streptomyces sp. NPDC059851 TaxID=3346971 RepID=UPI0036625FF1